MQTETASTETRTLAEIKLEWIKARIEEGRTVYLSTQTKHTKITRKYLDCLRVKNGVLEMREGRRWVDANRSALSAA